MLAPIIAQKIATIHAAIVTDPQIVLQCVSHVEPFGKATLDLSLTRLPAGTVDLDFATLLTTVLTLGHVVFKMNTNWFENDFRFQAIRMNDTLDRARAGRTDLRRGQGDETRGHGARVHARVRLRLVERAHGVHHRRGRIQRRRLRGGGDVLRSHTADKVHAAAKTQMVLVKP